MMKLTLEARGSKQDILTFLSAAQAHVLGDMPNERKDYPDQTWYEYWYEREDGGTNKNIGSSAVSAAGDTERKTD